MWISTILLGTATFLLVCLYRRRKQQHNVFKVMGVCGPEPHWFWGNYKSIYDKTKVIHEQQIEWTKRYGKLYGYFEGPKAILVTTDLDFLQQVFVKRFSSFHGRKPFPLSRDPDKCKNSTHIIQARGDSWKRLRTIINPTFSTGKLRQIVPVVHKKIDSLIGCLREEMKSTTGSVEISSFYKMLTMDVMGEAAFGMDIDVLRKEKMNHHLIQMCMLILREKPFFFHIGVVLPELKSSLLWALGMIMTPPFSRLGTDLDRAIQIRKEQNIRRKDLLQALIDAEVEDAGTITAPLPSRWTMEIEDGLDHDANEPAQAEAATPTTTRNKYMKPWMVQKKLSKEEIKQQSTVFIIAGFETTSTTLAYATYQLALNPDVQLTLQKEIDENIADEKEIDYEKLKSLPYLDQVVCETLRMYPLGSTVQNRDCMEDCVINGLLIPKGVSVQADVWTIHYDPEVWGPTDPYTFDPTRFSPEKKASRHPLAWMPFGAGPRNCVGLRFGMLEAKLVLARVLKNFTFQRCPETEVPLKLTETGSISPKNGIRVQMTAR